MSIFTMLLTCVTMERIFFEDYASRLNLDHVLVGMRAEFERHKESTREYMKDQYHLEMPEAKGILIL